MTETDHDLLQQFVRDGDQVAFTTIVERHLDLVYSVARRQVQSPQLAEEVAQTVFTDLARQARRFSPDTPLVAWLHVVARRTAIDVVRCETRRHARELHAAEIARTDLPDSFRGGPEPMKPTVDSWTAVEPLLDEAVESLPPLDRSAILLRFFQNKNLREVGAALGTSDDAAQKRVSRALDQLRTFFLRRGVVVTAAGLASDLSAHALQTAPTGLLASVSACATATTAAGIGAISAKTVETIAMTTLQKAALAAALTVTLGAGFFEASVVSRQRDELQSLQAQTDGVFAELRQLRQARERDLRSLASLQVAPAQPTPASTADTAMEAAMHAWFDRVDRVKQALRQHPELSVPELTLLGDDAIFSLVQNAQLDTDEHIRAVVGRLRGMAENSMASKISAALTAYTRANGGQLPPNSAALASYCTPQIEAALLKRYDVVHTGALDDVPPSERGSIVVMQSPIDPEADNIWQIGPNSYRTQSPASYAVRQARRDFAAAHNGARAATPTDLRPYLKWPLSDQAVQQAMK